MDSHSCAETARARLVVGVAATPARSEPLRWKLMNVTAENNALYRLPLVKLSQS
jgi:hypothetical protein